MPAVVCPNLSLLLSSLYRINKRTQPPSVFPCSHANISVVTNCGHKCQISVCCDFMSCNLKEKNWCMIGQFIFVIWLCPNSVSCALIKESSVHYSLRKHKHIDNEQIKKTFSSIWQQMTCKHTQLNQILYSGVLQAARTTMVSTSFDCKTEQNIKKRALPSCPGNTSQCFSKSSRGPQMKDSECCQRAGPPNYTRRNPPHRSFCILKYPLNLMLPAILCEQCSFKNILYQLQ